jgi:hypothetical protein
MVQTYFVGEAAADRLKSWICQLLTQPLQWIADLLIDRCIEQSLLKESLSPSYTKERR